MSENAKDVAQNRGLAFVSSRVRAILIGGNRASAKGPLTVFLLGCSTVSFRGIWKHSK